MTDIFLSPVKPPTKSSVSAEAVNASLYYLHVATPEDEEVLQQVELQRKQDTERRMEELQVAGINDPAQREFARMNTIRRKPVKPVNNDPEPAPQLEQENNSPPNASLEHPGCSSHPLVGNGPVNDFPAANELPANLDISAAAKPAVDTENKSPITRRPLPPVPSGEEPWEEHLAVNPTENDRTSSFTGLDSSQGLSSRRDTHAQAATGRFSLDSNRPHLPPRPSQDRVPSPRRNQEHSPSGKRGSQQSPPKQPGFRITLIRRDPGSGTQWNVATISTSSPTDPVDLEISTPGYNRFAASNEPLSLASLAANLPPGLIRTAGSSLPPALQPPSTEQPSDQPTGPRKFQRQLCASKPFDDSSSGLSDLKSGYYVFTSPWNGTCTFSSSVNGRSLKCKHMIPAPSNASADEDGEYSNPAMTVAEIRFNTPGQAANLHQHATRHTHSFASHFPTFNPQSNRNNEPTSPTSKRASLSQFFNPNNYSRPRAHSGPHETSPTNSSDPQRPNFNPTQLIRQTSLRAGQFAARQAQSGHSHLHRRRNPSTSSEHDSDEDRLDLSLAKERAGGGMRGTSAKLGKLIIEDEGIKMLDLVVAACMAVWWRGYYH